MNTTFSVKAETHEGNVMTLRAGFASREDAEDHPVQMSLWKRVWVEPVAITPKVEPILPPKPWDWISAGSSHQNGNYHAYLVDATGRKIAAIWGGAAKQLIADHILDRVNSDPAMSKGQSE